VYQNQFRLRRRTGEYRWALVTANPEKGPDGEVRRWIGTCTDIHDRMVAEAALAEKERLYRSVLEASADCIKILTLDGRLQLMNEPGLKLMEVPDFARLEGKFWWEAWPTEMQPTVRDSVKAAARGDTVRFSGFCPTAGGKRKWWDVVVTPIRCGSDEVSGILAISRDSTVERQKSEELAWASEHDSLTSLPNRRAFQKRLQAAALRAMQNQTKVGLLLIDLDHFKHVNDTLGHAAGDAMLKEFGRRLKQNVRSADFVARVGGDEFAIIVENVRSGYDLLTVSSKAVAALNAPLRLQGRALSGGASIGGATFPDDADCANELFKLADTALYALKAEGRGGTKLFHAYMREEAQRVASQLSLARDVVDESTVAPFYQPKIDLRARTTIGFEALLRWRHPSRGLQPPDTIEEAFKDYELASKIGGLMQSKVFADLRTWNSKGLGFGRVSINAAPAEFLRDDYAERLFERLEKHEIDPSALEIEITEHVLMVHGTKYVSRALAELRRAGITIALDDFGTGHSSLSHLRDFPVDVLKIDKSFVQQLGVDPEISAIVAAVIDLAKSLRIQSVAEGVETEAQADLLRATGCNVAQGYLLGAPRGAEVVEQQLGRRAAA
jgi:diguanylate cyclase (GGDEF)-like protein/PAS domain S-box-containing protein